MTTVSLELPLRAIEPAVAELTVGMSWRSHRDEDRLLVDPSAALYGVFDGAGGHGDGAAAAGLAAAAVNRRVRAGLAGCRDVGDVASLLDQALQDADDAIAAFDSQRPDAATSPSATTATVALICRRPADPSRLVGVIANLGDSRAHLIRAGRLEVVTVDHSYLTEPDPLQAKARQDRLDAATSLTDLDDPMDRAAFAHRHLLANALTGSGLDDVRHYFVELAPGDRLVLDTDGLHDNLTFAQLQEVFSAESHAAEAAKQAVEQAWELSLRESEELTRAKPDDITVLVLDVKGQASGEDSGGTGAGAYRLLPGGAVSLSLREQTQQYLVSAADLQLLVARRDDAWWVIQPGAAHAEPGSWPLRAGESVEFGRHIPGGFRTEPSEQVSRRHVALTLNAAADMLSVADLNSTNGTAVLSW